MNITPNPAQAELLSRMARRTIEYAYLGSINGSNVYQLSEGWQRSVLLDEPNVAVIMNAAAMEEAVKAPDIHTLFVPKNAALTQEIAERILMRNPLSKTIFWEV